MTENESAPARRLLPMGERAFLVEVDSLGEVLEVHAQLAASVPEGVLDLVPAARTVLVRVDTQVLSLAAARAWAVMMTDAAPAAARGTNVVELEVSYDGADLAETADLLGITVEELVRRHTSANWTVAFTGFAPGFGYLVSPDWDLDVPRRSSPRTRVPRGAVGLAAGFTGAYPRDTPGGWQLIGTTAATLFDPDAVPPASPALLTPGTRVRFVPRETPAPTPFPAPNILAHLSAKTGDLADTGHSDRDRPAPARSPVLANERAPERAPAPTDHPALRILEPGLLATLQDLGRPGHAALGVAPSGALDRTALRTANRLLGNAENNAESAAAIEVTMGGFRALATRDVWFAVTGAWGEILLAGRPVDPYEAHLWPAGAELALDWFAHGARAYLAVRGGFEASAVLGSRSTDVLAGLGPERLRAGSDLAVASDTAGPIPVPQLVPWSAPHDEQLEVELAPGPRADWFTPDALRTLFEGIWTLTSDTDRVGMRLDGPALQRAHEGELPSEGMVPGALQVPPGGRPMILLADGPVTGGYPVIAVATDAGLDLLAQARPGTRIRFRHARASF